MEAGQPPDRAEFLRCHAEVADALAECLEGLEFLQEAAQVLGIDPGAASQRYGRALLRLRKLLLAGGFQESVP